MSNSFWADGGPGGGAMGGRIGKLHGHDDDLYEYSALMKLAREDVCLRAVVVGDPARAAQIAGMLGDSRHVAQNREYATYRGSWQGVEVMVASHGIGGAGAVICFEELARLGVRRMVRVGTAGGLQPHINSGDIVVATGAVRDDGLSNKLMPLAYPAVADFDLTLSLIQAAKAAGDACGLSVYQGVVATMANFYASPLLPNEQLTWRDCGAVAVEMEVATLFVSASINGVQAGAILAVDGNPLATNDTDMVGYNPFHEKVAAAVATAAEVGLNTVIL